MTDSTDKIAVIPALVALAPTNAPETARAMMDGTEMERALALLVFGIRVAIAAKPVLGIAPFLAIL